MSNRVRIVRQAQAGKQVEGSLGEVKRQVSEAGFNGTVIDEVAQLVQGVKPPLREPTPVGPKQGLGAIETGRAIKRV